MKRFILLIVSIVFISTSNIAQDLVVTLDHDSINCKITNIKTAYIYFTYKKLDEYKHTLISRDKVSKHQIGFYDVAEVPKEKVIGYEAFQQFRIVVEGGYSSRLAGVSQEMQPEIQDYFKKLKRGFHIAGELSYFFNTRYGIGFRGNLSKASNSMGSVYVEDEDGNIETGVMKDLISMIYLGPSFLSRHINSKNNNEFCFGLGMGYLMYENDAVLIDEYMVTGATMALSLDFSYYIPVSKTSAIGFKLATITGSLFNVEYNDGITVKDVHLEKGQVIDLRRIDLSIGFRFGY